MERLFNWSFPIGKIARIPIRVHWLFLLTPLFWSGDLTTNLLLSGALFLSVLIHELGHALMARRVGGNAHEILMWPLGGLAFVSHPGDVKDDLKVTLAGPAVHIPIALICFGALVAMGNPPDPGYFSPFWGGSMPTDYASGIVLAILKTQVMLFLFNMLVPAYPLDSGKVLIASMLLYGVARQTTATVVTFLSVGVGVVLMTYFGAPFIGLFVLISAWQLHSLNSTGNLERHPTFAHIPHRVRSQPKKKKRKNHLKLVVGRHCPDCKRQVPANAKMCGFCEKMLPPE